MRDPEDPGAQDFAALYDEAPCGLLVTDDDGTIRLVNATFCRWLGLERDALVGKVRFQDLLTMGARIFHQTHWAPLLRMQGSVGEVKLDAALAGGRKLPMVMNVLRRERADGSFRHELAMFVARDRDSYERELQRARKQAETLLAEVEREHAAAGDRATFAEQMVGIVSHDLRNPLSTIKLAAQLLANPSLGAEQRARMLGNIDRAIARSSGLISDLLDFTMARIGRGLSVHVAPIALHDVVAGHVAELATAYPRRALVHEARGIGDCSADSDRLFQLVSNLVSNAMAHGDPGAPVVVTSSIEPRSFAVAVHNSGPPIPDELLARMFKPMVRGEGASSVTRSVGLGLYIVSEIARAHGGDVRVETGSGGTTFTASFPRLARATAPVPANGRG